ncbi:MAG TPA: SIS domain-containing protein [Acidimicrobiales bacterium]|nr:SIS domain-containing protein [Acidimicrobiales bacterium]
MSQLTGYGNSERGETGPPELANKFPTGAYAQISAYAAAYFEEVARAWHSIDLAQLERAAAILTRAYTTGSQVFSCGNGGSAAIANHFLCDHLKAVRTGTGLSPKVTSLSTNIELMSAISNDLGYEEVFRYQLEAQSRPGDVLVAISSSGRSDNIVRTVAWAKRNGRHTISLTGFDGGKTRTTADVAIHVDCANYGVIEDVHQAVMHTLAQYVRQAHLSPGTVAITTF